MTKKRQNIDTIAEVLIDKLNDMERLAKRIEVATTKAENTVVKVNSNELQEILRENRQTEKSILSDLSRLKEKNSTRVPNWVLIVLAVVVLTSIVYSMAVFSVVQQSTENKMRADYYEQEYNKLKK